MFAPIPKMEIIWMPSQVAPGWKYFRVKNPKAWKKDKHVFKSLQKFLKETFWRFFFSIKICSICSLSLVFHDEQNHVHLMLGSFLSFSFFSGLYIQQSYEIQHYCHRSSRMCLEFENVSLDLCWTCIQPCWPYLFSKVSSVANYAVVVAWVLPFWGACNPSDISDRWSDLPSPTVCMELPWGCLWKVLLCTMRKLCSSQELQGLWVRSSNSFHSDS